MEFQSHSELQIYDQRGRRKYLTERERRRFLAAADTMPTAIRALAHVLTITGCRVSEALALTYQQLDLDACALTFRTLKRRKVVFRSVPISENLASMLGALQSQPEARFWTMHRTTAWRHVKRLLRASGVQGPMACCRGLRHGFGIRAAMQSVPANLIQRWMGHALPTTTAIYLDAIGEEERQFAERVW